MSPMNGIRIFRDSTSNQILCASGYRFGAVSTEAPFEWRIVNDYSSEDLRECEADEVPVSF